MSEGEFPAMKINTIVLAGPYFEFSVGCIRGNLLLQQAVPVRSPIKLSIIHGQLVSLISIRMILIVFYDDAQEHQLLFQLKLVLVVRWTWNFFQFLIWNEENVSGINEVRIRASSFELSVLRMIIDEPIIRQEVLLRNAGEALALLNCMVGSHCSNASTPGDSHLKGRSYQSALRLP